MTNMDPRNGEKRCSGIRQQECLKEEFETCRDGMQDQRKNTCLNFFMGIWPISFPGNERNPFLPKLQSLIEIF